MAFSGQAAPRFVRLAAHPVRWRLLSELARGDYRVRELVALLDRPQNLVSYHLRQLRGAGLVGVRRSDFDGRDGYYHLDLDRCAHELAASGAALHPGLRLSPPPSPPTVAAPPGPLAVLFTCTGNSARSPIAEALLQHHTGGGVDVVSAGSRPKPRIHPDAERVLRDEYDIDIAGRRPRHLDTLSGRRFDFVITLCDKVREVCPEFGDQARRVHWSIPDPATSTTTGGDRPGYPAFQRTAAEIDTRIRHLLAVLTHQVRSGGR